MFIAARRADTREVAVPMAAPMVVAALRRAVRHGADRELVRDVGAPRMTGVDDNQPVAVLPTPIRPLNPAGVLDAVEVSVQPIIDVATGAVHAAEALARFPAITTLSTEEVFAAAHRSGFGYALEAACVRAAISARDRLPDGVALTINVSPGVLCHPLVARSWPHDLDGVIVEVTEHDAGDTIDFRNRVLNMRRRGARIAVDDVSTGYAGLLRLATLYPDYVKIDRQVVTGVRDSLAQTAVLETLVGFSHRLGAAVIGEGVETFDDLVALSEFDVDLAQGWAVGRPAATLEPISELVVETCQDGRRQVLRQPNGAGTQATHAHTLFSVAADLANAGVDADLGPAVTKVAEELGVDVIGVSVLTVDGDLREIANAGDPVDPSIYRLDEYPVTRAAIESGAVIEVQLGDRNADSCRAGVDGAPRPGQPVAGAGVRRPPATRGAGVRTPHAAALEHRGHSPRPGLAENLSPALQRSL